MQDFKQEFYEFETISKAYVDSFLNNYFSVTLSAQNSKVPKKIIDDMANMYIMYEYLGFKQKSGLNLKEEEFKRFLLAIGRSNYAQTLVDYCSTCGKFTRDRYDEISLVKSINEYNKKKFNVVLSNYVYANFDQGYMMEKYSNA